MTPYLVEFHRHLEQKWTSRIEQILTLAANATPPRNPNDNDDDEDEAEDKEDEDQPDEPTVVREPDASYSLPISRRMRRMITMSPSPPEG